MILDAALFLMEDAGTNSGAIELYRSIIAESNDKLQGTRPELIAGDVRRISCGGRCLTSRRFRFLEKLCRRINVILKKKFISIEPVWTKSAPAVNVAVRRENF